jgi:acyl-coenzyme A thioesterase PaaI-like protein
MGIQNALALEAVNITRLEQLAWADAVELTGRLRAQGRRVRVEEARIWIREANRIQPAAW